MNPLSTKSMHPRNIHKEGYNFDTLIKNFPEVKSYVTINNYGLRSIDFANPRAVLALNKGLLFTHYNIKQWDLAKGSLCPPVPGRADYIHHLADLLAKDRDDKIPHGEKVRVLDIGTGSSIIYPIIGQRIYGWSFVGTDIDTASLHFAEKNINGNGTLKNMVSVRLQPNRAQILDGIITKGERFDAVMCNPPFFKSREDNWNTTSRKFHNLHKNKEEIPVQNFGGHPNELWCEGGEKAFVRQLIYESMKFKGQLGWVTSLISDKMNLKPLVAVLEYHKAAQVEIIPMALGNKVSRILAWKWA